MTLTHISFILVDCMIAVLTFGSSLAFFQRTFPKSAYADMRKDKLLAGVLTLMSFLVPAIGLFSIFFLIKSGFMISTKETEKRHMFDILQNS